MAVIFTQAMNGDFTATKLIKVRFTVRDLFYALAEHPTHQSRNGIISNAAKLYDPVLGYSGKIKLLKNKNLDLYAQIIERRFQDIPLNLIADEVLSIRKELKKS